MYIPGDAGSPSSESWLPAMRALSRSESARGLGSVLVRRLWRGAPASICPRWAWGQETSDLSGFVDHVIRCGSRDEASEVPGPANFTYSKVMPGWDRSHSCASPKSQ